jgi:hypothetical protein
MQNKGNYINIFIGTMNGNLDLFTCEPPHTEAEDISAEEVKEDNCNAGATDQSEGQILTENTDFAQALAYLMEEKSSDDKYLFKQKCQWIAVYRTFVDYYKWNIGYHEFVTRVHGMGNFRIPCSEDAVRRIDGIFNKPFSEWDIQAYKGRECTFHRQYRIAKRLMEILKEQQG